MAHNEVVIAAPTIPDLKHLAVSTSKALALLRPWCTKEGFSTVTLQSIREQSQSYVKAINFSVIAAQHGFNVAQEAISFAKNIDFGTERDRQEYLGGMVAIAIRAEKNAKDAHETFRDVRVKVLKLIDDAKSEASQRTMEPAISDILDDLEKGTSVLEELRACISQYIEWWNEQKMTHTSLTTSSKELVINYGTLRRKAVVQKWQELKQAYTEYANTIGEIQDANLYFAEELKQCRQAEAQHIPQTPLIYGPAPMVFGPIAHFNKRAEENIKAHHHRFRFWLS